MRVGVRAAGWLGFPAFVVVSACFFPFFLLVFPCWLVLGWPGSRRFPGVCGVSRGSLSLFLCSPSFFGGFVRPLPVRALGGWCAGRFFPPVVPRFLGVRRRGAVFVPRRRWPVLSLLGAALRRGWRSGALLRGPRGPRWLGGLGSRGPAARARGARSRVPLPCGPLRRPVRRRRLGVAAVVAPSRFVVAVARRRSLSLLRRRAVFAGRCPFCGRSLRVCRPAWPGLPLVAPLAGCFVGPVAALPLAWA